MKKQVVLIVLDGWGYREDKTHNAIAESLTPNFNQYWDEFPHTLIEASGLAVGLPEGQMGNSEIGHTTIGAGKTIDTDLVKIKKAMDTGAYATNPAFQGLFTHVQKHNSTLHVMGLLGDGGVHSHSDHLFAFIEAAKAAGIKRVAIHIFTDGRDTPPQSAAKYLVELENLLEEIEVGFIATVSGRYFAMDRDNNWDRLEKVEKALFECKGHVCAGKPSDVVASLYKDGKLDEHLEPMIFGDAGNDKDEAAKNAAITDNDAIFFFNFRADRARMLTRKLMEKATAQNILLATQTSYGSEFDTLIAFPPSLIETTLAKEISGSGLTQAHIAETEKFPHATYFLNGGVEKPYNGEKHILLDSRKDVATHDLAPKMRAEAIADKAIEEIKLGTDFIFINFANPDMVGHTANVPAIIEALEETDKQLGRVVGALHVQHDREGSEAREGIAFITADHGNAEMNVDPITGEKHTSHTINPVPVILTKRGLTLRTGGSLSDITPTILGLFEIQKPATMTGESLVIS